MSASVSIWLKSPPPLPPYRTSDKVTGLEPKKKREVYFPLLERSACVDELKICLIHQAINWADFVSYYVIYMYVRNLRNALVRERRCTFVGEP